MDFCINCDNMLYIRQDLTVENETSVQYFCKYCDYNRPISSNNESILLSSTSYSMNEQNNDLYLNSNIEFDKSIPHTSHITCVMSNCSKNADEPNDVMFMKYDNTNMLYLYYCTYCKSFWKQNKNKNNVQSFECIEAIKPLVCELKK